MHKIKIQDLGRWFSWGSTVKVRTQKFRSQHPQKAEYLPVIPTLLQRQKDPCGSLASESL